MKKVMRSKKKGLFITKGAMTSINSENEYARKMHVSKLVEGALIRVNNGKTYIPLHILSDMVGYPIGAFVQTKKRGANIHLKGKKKKKGNK